MMEFEPRVVNLRDRPDSDLPVRRIDRKTPFGNPFVKSAAHDRAEVIEMFREWIYQPEQEHLRDRMITELAGCDLACWCAPRPCHGDVILEIVTNGTENSLVWSPPPV